MASRSHGAGPGWYRWKELKRHEVRELAPEALVVVPLGAVEQHGPHLPTGTDYMLSSRAVEGALDRAAVSSERPFLLADVLGIGCSAHHLPFGGTISLTPGVMGEVLADIIRSMTASGVRRVVMVNGHGGNSGICHAAASQAASDDDVAVAVVDYWESAAVVETADAPVPGHAGRFETSLMLAVHPELVHPDRERPGGESGQQPGRGVYGPRIWAGIDGFTDAPELASASSGEEMLARIVTDLATRLQALAEEMG